MHASTHASTRTRTRTSAHARTRTHTHTHARARAGTLHVPALPIERAGVRRADTTDRVRSARLSICRSVGAEPQRTCRSLSQSSRSGSSPSFALHPVPMSTARTPACAALGQMVWRKGRSNSPLSCTLQVCAVRRRGCTASQETVALSRARRSSQTGPQPARALRACTVAIRASHGYFHVLCITRAGLAAVCHARRDVCGTLCAGQVAACCIVCPSHRSLVVGDGAGTLLGSSKTAHAPAIPK